VATQTTITLEDDLAAAAGKTEPADESLTLALGSQAVEIDLSTKHADKLRDLLAPYFDAGRAVKASPNGRQAGRGRAAATVGRTAADKADRRAQNDAVRAWAGANGIPVNARGRISADIYRRFADAGSPGL
jgi:hypothetical protein